MTHPKRDPPRTGRALINMVAGLANPIRVEGSEQPEEGYLNLKMVRNLERLLAAKGDINELEPDHFEEFVNYDDQTMRAVVRVTILAFRKCINAVCFSPKPTTDETIFETIELFLYLVARGNVLFYDDNEGRLFKPVGPRMTPDMHRRILGRIRSDRKMHGEVVVEIVKRQQRKRPEVS